MFLPLFGWLIRSPFFCSPATACKAAIAKFCDDDFLYPEAGNIVACLRYHRSKASELSLFKFPRTGSARSSLFCVCKGFARFAYLGTTFITCKSAQTLFTNVCVAWALLGDGQGSKPGGSCVRGLQKRSHPSSDGCCERLQDGPPAQRVVLQGSHPAVQGRGAWRGSRSGLPGMLPSPWSVAVCRHEGHHPRSPHGLCRIHLPAYCILSLCAAWCTFLSFAEGQSPEAAVGLSSRAVQTRSGERG